MKLRAVHVFFAHLNRRLLYTFDTLERICADNYIRWAEGSVCLQGIGVLKKLRIVLEMVKIEHTIFALPFALLGAILAVRSRGLPQPSQIAWILLAMVGARSAAMAFNRLVDLPFDARNPRTANRALPKKQLTQGFVIAFIAVSAAILVFAASRLNRLALELSPLALGIIFLYSYTKRFT